MLANVYQRLSCQTIINETLLPVLQKRNTCTECVYMWFFSVDTYWNIVTIGKVNRFDYMSYIKSHNVKKVELTNH